MKGSGARLPALFVVFCLGGPALAHVGPSDTTNNRYYKLTPMSDRVRLAYTIFFGREPGQVMRQRMDVDRDGVLSPAEVSTYSQVIAKELIASVSFLQGGKETKLSWQDVDVGMGTMDVAGGPFSVDLIGTVCLDHRKLDVEHQLVFRDRLRLPKPGETELSLAPAPGIQITKSVLDGRTSRHSEKWQGGPGPAQSGYEFAFTVQRDQTGPLDASCTPPPPRGTWTLWFAAAGAALALLAGFWIRRLARPKVSR